MEALLRSVLSSPEMIGDRAEHDFPLIDSLRHRWKNPGIRLSPVIRLDQSPTKSGTYMLRLLARSLRLQERWMVWPQALQMTPLGVHTVVLVDDFCGSGAQFAEFVSLTELNAFMSARPGCRIVYVTAAAHADGVARIREQFPQIEVLSELQIELRITYFRIVIGPSNGSVKQRKPGPGQHGPTRRTGVVRVVELRSCARHAARSPAWPDSSRRWRRHRCAARPRPSSACVRQPAPAAIHTVAP